MCEIGGIKFANRVWNAPVPTSFQDFKDLNESDAGAIVFKTITLNPKQGNPNEWTLHNWGSQNNVALHNAGLSETIKTLYELQPIKPVFISVFGNEEELLQIVQRLNRTKETILIEWNLTCPNVTYTLDIVTILPKLRAACKHPLGLKLSINTPLDLAPFFEENKIDFLSLINSVRGKGGLCIRDQAIDTVRNWARVTSIPIIGVGGIQSKRGAQEFFNVGATAAEIGTAFLRQGVRVFNNPARLKLVPLLYAYDIVQKGSFRLKSGQLSDFYIDFRKALSIPVLWENIIVQVLEKIRGLEFDAVCGVPSGAVPLASIIALRCGKPLLLCRKDAKAYGNKNKLEGKYNGDWKCLIVEDVITTGGSVMETFRTLTDHGVGVKDVLTLANRSGQSKAGNLRIHSLFTLKDLQNQEEVLAPSNNDAMRLVQIIDNKKTRVCFSADIEDPEELLRIVKEIGPYICMVKIHTDVVDQWETSYHHQLNHWAEVHNFLLLADRKLADIPSIVKKQCKRLKTFAPFTFVTVHTLPGPDILDAIEECGMSAFVVAQMSCNRGDWDPVYARKSVCMAEHHPAVTGLVCQEPLSDFLLHAVPGIGTGKNHRAPDDMGFADILIVGRAIYNAEDPVKVARELSNL
jgi:uridine monophosphate synthetase